MADAANNATPSVGSQRLAFTAGRAALFGPALHMAGAAASSDRPSPASISIGSQRSAFTAGRATLFRPALHMGSAPTSSEQPSAASLSIGSQRDAAFHRLALLFKAAEYAASSPPPPPPPPSGESAQPASISVGSQRHAFHARSPLFFRLAGIESQTGVLPAVGLIDQPQQVPPLPPSSFFRFIPDGYGTPPAVGDPLARTAISASPQFEAWLSRQPQPIIFSRHHSPPTPVATVAMVSGGRERQAPRRILRKRDEPPIVAPAAPEAQSGKRAISGASFANLDKTAAPTDVEAIEHQFRKRSEERRKRKKRKDDDELLLM